MKTKTGLFLILLIIKTITGFAQDQQKIEYSNLVKNGDFENGNTGFKSDFIFAQGNSWNVGYYIVTDNLVSDNVFPGKAFSNPVPNTGKYYAVQVDANWNQRLWYDSVTVKPNTTYSFTCMLANISSGFANPGLMSLKVNGKTCCSTHTLPEGSSEWIPFSMVYTTKSDETRIEISIVDEIVTQTRNDVGLDNIVFKELPKDTTITGELIELGVPTTRSSYIANLSSIVGIEGKIFVFRNKDGSNAYINICYPERLFKKGFFVIGKKYKIACTKTQINSCSVYNPKNYTNLLFEQSIVRLD
jgi:hypothetical protein